MTSSIEDGDSSIKAYKLLQHELREFGETKEAMSLLIRLLNLMRRHLDCRVQRRAGGDAPSCVPKLATRPQRYTIGTTTVCPIES